MEWGVEFYGRACVRGYVVFFVVFIGEDILRGVSFIVVFECGSFE